MVEFTENLSKRFVGVPAVAQRATYRLSVRKGEIPYFPGGLDVQEFTYNNNLNSHIKRLLSDFDVNVSVSGDRVLLGDIQIQIPRSISG